MKRRALVRALATVLAAPVAGFAQSRGKMVRIGLVAGFAPAPEEEQHLMEGLREQGLVEGRNLIVVRRYAHGDFSKIPAMSRELSSTRFDVVVSTCTPTTLLAKKLFGSTPGSTPIVMAAVADPVGQKLIDSLARPGANITGLASQAEDIMPKMLSQFAAVLERPATVAVLVDVGSAVHPRMLRRLEAPARQLELRLVPVEAGSKPGQPSLSDAFEAAGRAGAQGLFVLPDEPFFFAARSDIVALAARHRLPAFYGAREFVSVGGLMSYGEDLNLAYRNVGGYVAKIIDGTSPAVIPVSQPTRFVLALNLRTAQTLGITMPGDLLLSADVVIR